MTEFFKRTESHFRFTWEALVSNRLAIHLLSSGSAMYDMVLRQYLHYYQNYDVTLDLCGQEKQPTEIDFTTYKVVDRKEFCKCSLTAGSFQLDETLVKCTPEINSDADGHFKSYFAINKIIFDYLQAEKDVQLDSTVVQVLSGLLYVKPEYDWTPLNWYVNPDLPDNVINKQP